MVLVVLEPLTDSELLAGLQVIALEATALLAIDLALLAAQAVAAFQRLTL